jgi:hypothetical protein
VDVFRLLQLLIGMVTAGAAIVGAREPGHGGRAEHAPPSGTIRIDPVASSNVSDGTLQYDGRAYRLSIRMPGISVSEMEQRFGGAHVYHLSHLSHLSGAYGSIHQNAGKAAHNHLMLWLENGNGVVIALEARPGHPTPARLRSVNIAFTH